MEQELEVVNVRLVKEPSLYSEKKLNSPNAVVNLIAPELAQYDREVLCVINLKTNGQPINMSIVSIGTLNAAFVNPREIFKCSILSNAASIIILHNHPSGSLVLSQEDKLVTKKLAMCGELLDIPLRDHIVIAGETGEQISFLEQKLLPVSEAKQWVREIHGHNKKHDDIER
ncbi:MAG: JAB domain-containing protein [Lachnospiraceae bacterium]